MNTATVFGVGIGDVNVSCNPEDKPSVGVRSGMLISTAGLHSYWIACLPFCRLYVHTWPMPDAW